MRMEATEISEEEKGEDIFLVRGKEAVRLAEARLVAQVLAIRSAEVRAIAIVGWSVIGALASLAVIFGNYPSRFQLALSLWPLNCVVLQLLHVSSCGRAELLFLECSRRKA